MINKQHYFIEFLGKAILGGLSLIISVFLFAFISMIVSTKIHNESIIIMIALLIVAPFTAVFGLMGFRKIQKRFEESEFRRTKKKVEEPEFRRTKKKVEEPEFRRTKKKVEEPRFVWKRAFSTLLALSNILFFLTYILDRIKSNSLLFLEYLYLLVTLYIIIDIFLLLSNKTSNYTSSFIKKEKRQKNKRNYKKE